MATIIRTMCNQRWIVPDFQRTAASGPHMTNAGVIQYSRLLIPDAVYNANNNRLGACR